MLNRINNKITLKLKRIFSNANEHAPQQRYQVQSASVLVG